MLSVVALPRYAKGLMISKILILMRFFASFRMTSYYKPESINNDKTRILIICQ